MTHIHYNRMGGFQRSFLASLLLVFWLVVGSVPQPALAFHHPVAIHPKPWRTRPLRSSTQSPDQQQQQPRLCAVVGTLLNGFTRVALGFPSHMDQCHVRVEAASNRAVLRGRVDQVSIDVVHSKSSRLELQHLQVQAKQLDLGLLPTILAIGVPMLLFLRPLWMIRLFCLGYCWKVYHLLQNDSTTRRNLSNNNKNSFLARTKAQLDRFLNKYIWPKSCTFGYRLQLTNDNLQQSSLLQTKCQTLLTSLMDHSVLQTVAETADAALLLQQQQRQQREQQRKMQDKTSRDKLVWSFPKGGERRPLTTKFSPEGEVLNPETAVSFLTKLLSATSFQMHEPAQFTNDGHLILPSCAVLPNGRLDFVLRTTLEARPSGVVFGSPSCQMYTHEAVPAALRKLFPPVVWVPVGPGLIWPLESQHELESIQVSRGTCQMDGRVAFFGTHLAERNRISSFLNHQKKKAFGFLLGEGSG